MCWSLRASLGAGNKAAVSISRYLRAISFTDIEHFPRQNICLLSPCVSVSACLCLSSSLSLSFSFSLPWKHHILYVVQANSELRVLSASVAWVLGLKAYTTTLSIDSLFKRREIDIAVLNRTKLQTSSSTVFDLAFQETIFCEVVKGRQKRSDFSVISRTNMSWNWRPRVYIFISWAQDHRLGDSWQT